MFSFYRIGILAQNTLLELVRQRFCGFSFLIAFVFIVSVQFLQQFNFGSSALEFITDFGFAVMLFFGSILAIVLTSRSFYNEMEDRTVLTLLAKPMHRSEFIWGKFLGIQFFLFSFVLLVSFVLIGVLWWSGSALLLQNKSQSVGDGVRIDYMGILVSALFQWLKFGVLSALTLSIASFSRTYLYTVVVAFLVMIICYLQHFLNDFWLESNLTSARVAGRVLSLLLPNFQLFDPSFFNRVLFGQGMEVAVIFKVLAYGLVYILVFNGLAVFSFKNREV